MTQLSILDAIESQRLADIGMELAIEHADLRVPQWREKAYELAVEFINTIPGEFMTEELRAYAAMQDDFELPPHPRAWGGIIARLKNESLIEFVRNDKVKNVKAHRCFASVWRKK